MRWAQLNQTWWNTHCTASQSVLVQCHHSSPRSSVFLIPKPTCPHCIPHTPVPPSLSPSYNKAAMVVQLAVFFVGFRTIRWPRTPAAMLDFTSSPSFLRFLGLVRERPLQEGATLCLTLEICPWGAIRRTTPCVKTWKHNRHRWSTLLWCVIN